MAETIREFLVGLGFDVDERGLKKFEQGVDKVTVPVIGLAKAAVAATTAVGAMVTTVARQMEDLYYASQRTHATAESLQAVGYAAQQVGLQAGQGKDEIEGLARAMRTNPGTAGLLGNLGVVTSFNGKMRDTVEIHNDLLKKLALMPRYLALAYAPMFGQSPDALNQTLDNLPAYLAAQEKSREIQRAWGVDAQKLAADSKAFGNSIGTLTENFGALAQRVAQDWLPTAQKVVSYAQEATDAFRGWYTGLEDVERKVTDVAVAIGALWGAKKVFDIGRNMLGLGGGAAAGAAGSGIFGGLLRRLLLGGAAGGAVMVMDPSEANAGEDEEVRKFKANPRSYGVDADPAPPIETPPPRPTPTRAETEAAGQKVTNYFLQQGWTKEQAAAIAGALQGESAFDPKAYNPAGGGRGAHGIAQWRGDRIAEFERLYGKKIRDASLEEQLAYVQHELTQGNERSAGALLRGADTLQRAADVVTRNYERGGFDDIPRRIGYSQHWLAQVRPETATQVAQGGATGGAPVTINQTVTTTVNGATDPAAAGRAVGDAQVRANGDLTRNLAAAVR
ncbi:phage tail tip lysozyme [Azospirillum argentinense]